jgi:drug/metabolite transporter (DMT)-like permease
VTLIGIIGGVLLSGTQLTTALMVGVAIVLAGLLALALAATTATHMPNLLLGDLCFLGVGLIWGGYPLALQLWKIDGLKATAVFSVLSMLYLPVYALVYFRGFDVAPWQAIVFHGINQGLINVVIGLWLWAWATKILGVAVAGRFPPMIPVIGTILGMPVLGEWPGAIQLVGIAMIVGGLFIAAWKPAPKVAAGRS